MKRKMKNKNSFTFEYTLIQTFFWMSYGIAVSFASLYLQGLGYSNTKLGIILACGNIMAFVLSNCLGMLIDMYEKITVAKTITYMLILESITILLNAFINEKCLAMSIIYSLYIGFCASISSLNIKLGIDFLHTGKEVNYAFARAGGSFGFVFMSLGLGEIAKKLGVRYIPLVGIGILIIQLILNLHATRRLNLSTTKDLVFSREKNYGTPILQFVKQNGKFFVLLIGIAFVYIGHNAVGNFIINVVKNLGGDSSDMGKINAWMAFVEILPMVMYNKIRRAKSISASHLLILSFCAWTLKGILIAIAPTMGWLFGACTLQMLSYAIYTPAIVDYVSEIIPYKDSAKGQSLAMGMSTLGSLAASMVGGRLYDTCSVSNVLIIAALATAIGAIISIGAVKRIDKKLTVC